MENGFLPEFSLSATILCRIILYFVDFSTGFENIKKSNKIKTLRDFAVWQSTHFSISFKHCGKYVDNFKIFPQIHNLLTLWRHKNVKLIICAYIYGAPPCEFVVLFHRRAVPWYRRFQILICKGSYFMLTTGRRGRRPLRFDILILTICSHFRSNMTII